MKINSNAVGKINQGSSVTTTAKLSDKEINAIAKGSNGCNFLKEHAVVSQSHFVENTKCKPYFKPV